MKRQHGYFCFGVSFAVAVGMGVSCVSRKKIESQVQAGTVKQEGSFETLWFARFSKSTKHIDPLGRTIRAEGGHSDPRVCLYSASSTSNPAEVGNVAELFKSAKLVSQGNNISVSHNDLLNSVVSIRTSESGILSEIQVAEAELRADEIEAASQANQLNISIRNLDAIKNTKPGGRGDTFAEASEKEARGAKFCKKGGLFGGGSVDPKCVTAYQSLKAEWNTHVGIYNARLDTIASLGRPDPRSSKIDARFPANTKTNITWSGSQFIKSAVKDKTSAAHAKLAQFVSVTKNVFNGYLASSPLVVSREEVERMNGGGTAIDDPEFVVTNSEVISDGGLSITFDNSSNEKTHQAIKDSYVKLSSGNSLGLPCPDAPSLAAQNGIEFAEFNEKRFVGTDSPRVGSFVHFVQGPFVQRSDVISFETSGGDKGECRTSSSDNSFSGLVESVNGDKITIVNVNDSQQLDNVSCGLFKTKLTFDHKLYNKTVTNTPKSKRPPVVGKYYLFTSPFPSKSVTRVDNNLQMDCSLPRSELFEAEVISVDDKIVRTRIITNQMPGLEPSKCADIAAEIEMNWHTAFFEERLRPNPPEARFKVGEFVKISSKLSSSKVDVDGRSCDFTETGAPGIFVVTRSTGFEVDLRVAEFGGSLSTRACGVTRFSKNPNVGNLRLHFNNFEVTRSNPPPPPPPRFAPGTFVTISPKVSEAKFSMSNRDCTFIKTSSPGVFEVQKSTHLLAMFTVAENGGGVSSSCGFTVFSPTAPVMVASFDDFNFTVTSKPNPPAPPPPPPSNPTTPAAPFAVGDTVKILSVNGGAPTYTLESSSGSKQQCNFIITDTARNSQLKVTKVVPSSSTSGLFFVSVTVASGGLSSQNCGFNATGSNVTLSTGNGGVFNLQKM